MLKRDDQLRLSDETQRAYAKCCEFGDEKIRVTDAIQRRVCREMGFQDNIAEGLEVMQCALSMFPGDEAVKNACHYYRHNIHVPCPIKLGAEIPAITVHGTGGASATSLPALCAGFQGPTLLLAGSTT